MVSELLRMELGHLQSLKLPGWFSVMSGSLFPGGAGGNEPICQCRRHKRQGLDPWVGKIPWRRAWQPTPSSILAWSIPWTEEPGGLQSTGSQRTGHDWAPQHSTAFFRNGRFVAALSPASYWSHFSNSICPLCVSVSHFGNSWNIANSSLLLCLLWYLWWVTCIVTTMIHQRLRWWLAFFSKKLFFN